MRARLHVLLGVAAVVVMLTLFACRRGGLGSSAVEAPPAPAAPAAPAGTPVALVLSDRPALSPAGPRITLTASDGTGLVLTALSTRAVLEGPLAFTEMRLAFANPRPRTLEGTFKIVLPAGASISRFALRVGDAWQEGEVVERQRARAAYEDFLHRKQDPALLEQSAGNEFSARVFPIPGNGSKEIVVSYAEELRGTAPYVVSLRGLPRLGIVDAVATVAGSNVPLATLTRSGWVPDEDFVADRGPSAAADGVRSGDLVLARVHAAAEHRPEPLGSAIVLLDTSASRALDLGNQVRLLQRLAASVGEKDAGATWAVACFDQRVDEVFAGRAAAFDDAVAARILQRGALGASDLGRALAWAGERATRLGVQRVLVLSDGVATAGATERAGLVAPAHALASAGVRRIDAIASGGIRDEGVLRAIATAGLPHDGVVLADGDDTSVVLRRLNEATQSAVAVRVEGATWWYPRRIDGAQAEDETLVYAELPPASPVRIVVGDDRQVVPDLRPVERPLLERAWAQAKIASLVDAEATRPDADALRKEIVTLSTTHRVLSPYTALLVLETEWDYQRLGIDHTSLTDILAVQGSRVALAHRSDAVASPQGGPQGGRKAAAEEAAQFGMIGLTSASATATADPNAPAAPWGTEREGRDEARGGQELPRAASAQARARGEAWGDGIGEAFGSGGLGLSGVGRGAGGAASVRAASSPARAELAQAAESAAAPYAGRFAEVMTALEKHDAKSALAGAQEWHASSPGDVMALVALGEALEASSDPATAARAYGSIIDLYPSRADLRRMAGERLERVRDPAALELALDTYAKALEQRPDHPSSHRMLAFALLRKGDYARAFEAALAGLAFRYPSGRFAGVEQVLREDLGLIGAAWARAEPDMRAAISARVRAAGGTIEDAPSLRFVLSWETDANDVDLHVRDASGETAFYSHPTLASGGSLVADVTTGYGPECFTVRLPRGKRSSKYTVRANYYSRGPMGYGMGKLEVVEHDGHGGLAFEERPFVVMNDHAFVELGAY